MQPDLTSAKSGTEGNGAATDNTPSPDSSTPSTASANSKLAVYIGDSSSDFAPLLRADLGIVVGQNKLLRQVAKAYGVKLKPLTAGDTWLRARHVSTLTLFLPRGISACCMPKASKRRQDCILAAAALQPQRGNLPVHLQKREACPVTVLYMHSSQSSLSSLVHKLFQ